MTKGVSSFYRWKSTPANEKRWIDARSRYRDFLDRTCSKSELIDVIIATAQMYFKADVTLDWYKRKVEL